MKYNAILFLLAFFLNGCTNAQTQEEKNKLSAVEFFQKIEQTSESQIIDVRTPKEFEGGHIKNAMNLNINGEEFDEQLATLDKSKPVFVYCLSGGRSGKATAMMSEAGFVKIYEMPGGMMEWRSENLPEEIKKKNSKGISQEEYEALLKSDKLVLVDFYADWCAPCKKMKPYLDNIEKEMSDVVTLIRVNADENSELCKNLNVKALPMLKLYENKLVVWEAVGFTEENETLHQISKYNK